MRELALEASRRGEDAASEFKLPENTVPGLVKLALHDFVFLCGQLILPQSLRAHSPVLLLYDS